MDEAIRSPRHASKYSDDVRAGVALSLLAAFDFQSKGIVTKDEWDRGTKLLGLQQEDSSVWERLHQTYGDAEDEDDGIDLDNIPQRSRDIGLVSDATIMSTVLKGLIGGLAAVAEAVEELRDLPDRVDSTDERAAALSKIVGDLSGRVDGLSGRVQMGADVRTRRATLSSFRAVVQPAFEGWCAQASKQRRQRREMALSALAPGLSRCFAFWVLHTEREAYAARIPGIALSIVSGSRKRVLHKAIYLWKSAAYRNERMAQAWVHAFGHNKTTAFKKWKSIAATLADMRAIRAARATRPPSPPQPQPQARASSPPPPMRAVATGWHTDLSLYGTPLSHREESLARAQHLRTSEKDKVETLETKLAFAEAKAAVLERRLALRERVLETSHGVGRVVTDRFGGRQGGVVYKGDHGYTQSPPPVQPPVQAPPVQAARSGGGEAGGDSPTRQQQHHHHVATQSAAEVAASAEAAEGAAAQEGAAQAADAQASLADSAANNVEVLGGWPGRVAASGHEAPPQSSSSPPAPPAPPVSATLNAASSLPHPPLRPPPRPKSASAATSRARVQQQVQQHSPVYQHIQQEPPVFEYQVAAASVLAHTVQTRPLTSSGSAGGAVSSVPMSARPRAASAARPTHAPKHLPPGGLAHRKAPQRPEQRPLVRVDYGTMDALLSLEGSNGGASPNGAGGNASGRRPGMRTPGHRAGY